MPDVPLPAPPPTLTLPEDSVGGVAGVSRDRSSLRNFRGNCYHHAGLELPTRRLYQVHLQDHSYCYSSLPTTLKGWLIYTNYMTECISTQYGLLYSKQYISCFLTFKQYFMLYTV